MTSIYYDLIEIEKGIVSQNYQFKFYPEKNHAIISGLEYNDNHLEIGSNPILDSLSVYLALAEDVIANPSQTEFIYQIAGKHRVEEQYLNEFILKIFNDDKFADYVSKSAINSSKKYDWEHTSEKLNLLYEELKLR